MQFDFVRGTFAMLAAAIHPAVSVIFSSPVSRPGALKLALFAFFEAVCVVKYVLYGSVEIKYFLFPLLILLTFKKIIFKPTQAILMTVGAFLLFSQKGDAAFYWPTVLAILILPLAAMKSRAVVMLSVILLLASIAFDELYLTFVLAAAFSLVIIGIAVKARWFVALALAITIALYWLYGTFFSMAAADLLGISSALLTVSELWRLDSNLNAFASVQLHNVLVGCVDPALCSDLTFSTLEKFYPQGLFFHVSAAYGVLAGFAFAALGLISLHRFVVTSTSIFSQALAVSLGFTALFIQVNLLTPLVPILLTNFSPLSHGFLGSTRYGFRGL